MLTGPVLTGEDLHEQLSWHWEARLRPRLVGLTDGEAQWPPGGWTVVDGILEGVWPTPDPAPVTTMAWRLGHLGVLLADRASAHFGDRTWSTALPETADGLLDFVDAAYAQWSAGVLSVSSDRLGRAHQGPPGSSDERYPLWAVVLHVNAEVIHHGAEVALLRDLYRSR